MWNVFSLNRAGAFKSLKQVLGKYKVDIASLQEVRWKNKSIWDAEEYTIFCSGGNNSTFRMAFMVAKKLKHAVLKFEPVYERFCYLRIKSTLFNISLICAHVPIEDAEEETKEEFYEKLEQSPPECQNDTWRHERKGWKRRDI
jgi:exonuclease III